MLHMARWLSMWTILIINIMWIDYYLNMACFYSRQKAIHSVNNRPVLAKICDKLSKYYYKQAGWA